MPFVPFVGGLEVRVAIFEGLSVGLDVVDNKFLGLNCHTAG